MALTVYPAIGWDSLVSLEDADAYWAAMGNTAWAGTSEPLREAALRRGTQYVLAQRLLPAALDPVVHPNVEAATAEAAERHRNGLLYKEPDPAPIIEKTVGPLSIRYGLPGSSSGKVVPVIADLLVGLTQGSFGGQIFFERA